MKIIGFGGMAQAGKSTTALLFREVAYNLGYRPVNLAFADRLKNAATRLGFSKEKDPKQYREWCQRRGAERRDPDFRPGVSGPDYWVERLLRKVERLRIKEDERNLTGDPNSELLITVDDVRYQNEIDAVHSMFGIMIYVDGSKRIKDLDAEFRKHESERLALRYALGEEKDDIFDYVIQNNYGMPRLRRDVIKSAPIWFAEMKLKDL